jgi:FkbM family methyltransferase
MRLLQPLGIATVCDVGSMDGSDALQFRRVLPGASIVALEPNPRNFALMAADERLHRAQIRILPFAASDRRGEAPFYVIETDYGNAGHLARRGMSSLYERADWRKLTTVVQVPTVRLDELLAGESPAPGPIALWIDTEGMAFEVIRGGAGVLQSTQMIHVEVETQPVIGAAQKVFSDVERMLLDSGFVLLAADQCMDVMQFNALFIRPVSSPATIAQIARHVRYERVRRTFVGAVARFMPLGLRIRLARQLFETRCQ